ncbi:SAM-dependent methyltransferase [Actinophytocola gossypii]|uniref:SAM-dependent methyltransferase n=1 Tax=Actinophytocola gossypii TaxID=2812003 RepID=UPI0021A3B9FB|nr:methyltransferase domain-containing protein [Actinophytocola gossypii]
MTDTLAAARYARLRWNTPLAEDHADLLLERLALTADTSLVDLGCGWGELMLRAVAKTYNRAVGVDSDPAALDRARRAARERGLADRVEFVEEKAESFRGTADRAICIGAAHTLGGTRNMLTALADVVPSGRVLIGDGCWPAPPTPGALDLFGNEFLSLPDLVTTANATGWRVLHLSTASQLEWDDFESRHRAGQQEWLMANQDDPRAGEVREWIDSRERVYLTAYRGVLGFAYLVLGR